LFCCLCFAKYSLLKIASALCFAIWIFEKGDLKNYLAENNYLKFRHHFLRVKDN